MANEEIEGNFWKKWDENHLIMLLGVIMMAMHVGLMIGIRVNISGRIIRWESNV